MGTARAPQNARPPSTAHASLTAKQPNPVPMYNGGAIKEQVESKHAAPIKTRVKNLATRTSKCKAVTVFFVRMFKVGHSSSIFYSILIVTLGRGCFEN